MNPTTFIDHENSLSYKIGDQFLLLPEEHLLDVYQGTHPLYNKFQNFLVKNLESGSVVVEVGANVGDILVGVFQFNREISYVAVEGDPALFQYLVLKSSITRELHELGDRQIVLINEFISNDLSYQSFVGTGGTRSGILAKQDSNKIATKRLDEVLISLGLQFPRLLMIDVDGFDFDVLRSAIDVIRNNSPIIFFELTPSSLEKITDYLKVVCELKALGYNQLSLLDNFGNLILKECSVETLEELCLYVLRQNIGVGTRSVYYFDLLISHGNDRDWHSAVIKEYSPLS